MAEIGVSLKWDDFTRCWLGRTEEAGLRDILGARFEADGPRVIARRNVLYEERLEEVQPFTDAGRFLRRIPEGTRLAIATGSRRLEVEGILWRAVMTQSFHAIVTAEDYSHAKPDPDPFLVAARLLKLSPAACLVIEDSPSGVAAAHAAGMPVVAVERGHEVPGLERATWKVGTLDDLTLTIKGEVIVKENPSRGDMLA